MAEILHVVPKWVGLDNDEYQASFFLSVDPNPGELSIPEISTNITDWLQDMYDTIDHLVRDVITAIEYSVYFYDLLTDLQSHYFDGNWTFVGGSTTQSVSPQVAATVSAAVIGGDRPGQKRLLPFDKNIISQGLVTASGLTAMGNFATQWVTVRPASANFTYTPGIVSKGSPSIFRPFSGVTFARETVGTVRSRKRGIGI